jgi:hypothetical protein
MGKRLARPAAGAHSACSAKLLIRTTTGREAITRAPIIVLFVVTAALVSETQVSEAQSSYSYQWCAIYFGGDGGSLGGAMSCYYTSWEQCRITMLGIGGNCIESPYYHGQGTPLPRWAVVQPHHRHHDRTARLSARERLK